MNKKETVSEKVLKRFYGISGVLDEYKRGEINRIGNNAFIILFFYSLLSNFIATLFATRFPEITLWALIVSNLILVVFVIGGYVILAVGNLNLTVEEVEVDKVSKTRKQVIKKGVRQGLSFGIGMHLLTALTNVVSEGESIRKGLFSFPHIISSLLAGLFFGVIMTVVMLNRVKKIEE